MAVNNTEIDEFVRRQATDLIAEGFASDWEIIDRLSEDVPGYRSFEKAPPCLEQLVRELAAEHREREAQWLDPTDCDCLDAAFTALCNRGVLACQHYGFDEGDGHANMWLLAQDNTPPHVPHGYAFYTTQSTGIARETGDLYISYEAMTGTDEATAEVGKQVAEELRQAGLQVEWDGDPGKTILVTGLKWQRRREE